MIWKQISDSNLSYLSAFTPERQEDELVSKGDGNEVQAVILADEMSAIVGDKRRAIPIWNAPQNFVLR